MKFNYDEYPGKYAMSCETEEECQIFLKYLHNIGKSWCTGKSYLDWSAFEQYGSKVCYLFNLDKVGAIDDVLRLSYTILYFDEFEWDDYKTNYTPEDNHILDEFLNIFFQQEEICNMKTKQRMTKEKVIKQVSNKTGLTQRTVEAVLDGITSSIVESLSGGVEVCISDFGTFQPKQRAGRTGRNPHTNEPVHIPAQVVPYFKPSNKFKSSVRDGNTV